MSRMRNLTLASAQHLANMGHITPQHHAKIKAAAMKFPKMSFAQSPPPKIKVAKKPGAGAFGALSGPMQAQAPIPTNPGDVGPSIPAGTSTDYE